MHTMMRSALTGVAIVGGAAGCNGEPNTTDSTSVKATCEYEFPQDFAEDTPENSTVEETRVLIPMLVLEEAINSGADNVPHAETKVTWQTSGYGEYSTHNPIVLVIDGKREYYQTSIYAPTGEVFLQSINTIALEVVEDDPNAPIRCSQISSEYGYTTDAKTAEPIANTTEVKAPQFPDTPPEVGSPPLPPTTGIGTACRSDMPETCR